MSDKRKADWAERIGRSLWRKSIGADLAEEGWIERIADALRRAEKRGYERGKTDGYKEGHEDQMEMRRIERRECERT